MDSKYLTLDNPLFQLFLGNCATLLIKTSLMSILTVVVFYGSTPIKTVTKIKTKDDEEKDKTILEYPHVERVRRCHRNDLENILHFVILGLLYLATDPDPSNASIVFRIFTISRFFHTIVYLFAFPQPTRFLVFLVGFLINVYLACCVITHVFL